MFRSCSPLHQILLRSCSKIHLVKINTLSKIKIELNCGEMRSIKMSVNLHRILECTFRNMSLDKLLLSLFHRFSNQQTAKGRSGLSERSGIFRKVLSALKEIRPLRSPRAPLRSHALAVTRFRVSELNWIELFMSQFDLLQI